MNSKPKIVDLGCGRYKIKDSIGIDKYPEVMPDICVDFEKDAIPLEAESVDIVYCNQVMEHINDIFKVMNEIHRILKKDGILVIKVPYWSSEGAFRDPTHVRFFSEKSFDYWDPDCECAYYANTSPFKLINFEYKVNKRVFPRILYKLFGIRFLKAFNNTITEITFNLKPLNKK